MSDDEVDELLKAVDTSSGEINYVGEYSLVLLLELQQLTHLFTQTSSRRFSQTKPSSLYTQTHLFPGRNKDNLDALARGYDAWMDGVSFASFLLLSFYSLTHACCKS
jgi:hypothetical protein